MLCTLTYNVHMQMVQMTQDLQSCVVPVIDIGTHKLDTVTTEVCTAAVTDMDASCCRAGSYTRFLNLQVILIIMLQMLLCAACAGAALAWREGPGGYRAWCEAIWVLLTSCSHTAMTDGALLRNSLPLMRSAQQQCSGCKLKCVSSASDRPVL